MKKYLLILSALTLFTQASVAEGDGETLVGLAWGVTVEEAESAGFELDLFSSTRSGTSTFRVKEMPRKTLVQGTTYLKFGKEHGLQRIETTSVIRDDITGQKGMASYGITKMALEVLYGDGSYIEWMEDHKKDAFYPCLANSDCGGLFAAFKDKSTGSNTMLELLRFANKNDTGMLDLWSEGPQWAAMNGYFKHSPY